jgi:phage tail-like protein
MSSKKRIDCDVRPRFFVEIDGLAQARFRECSELDAEAERVAVADAPLFKRMPGALRWSGLTLRSGVADGVALCSWRRQVEEGRVEQARRSGSIVLCDQDDREVSRWNFVAGWPLALVGARSQDETLIEELTICHEGLERVK